MFNEAVLFMVSFIAGIEPPVNWPSLGDIRIEGISVRYAADLDNVLQDVTVHFHPGEKVR